MENELSREDQAIARFAGRVGRAPAGPSTPARAECQPGDKNAPEGNPAVREWPTLDPLSLHGLAGDIVRAIEPHS